MLFEKINLQLFADAKTQTTNSEGLSIEMKTYYSDYLIDNATAKLVHDQFGQKHPIPKNGGKTIEFRKFSPLPKLKDPLQEGVTPDGQSLTVTNVTATVAQYGGYVTLSDVLLLTAIDNNLVQATKLLGKQAGVTLDTITRDILMAEATNFSYAGGGTSADGNITVADVAKVVAKLRAKNAPTINGDYVAIIHPYVAHDLKIA
jgi:N4-gp56 family major capsid protein